MNNIVIGNGQLSNKFRFVNINVKVFTSGVHKFK